MVTAVTVDRAPSSGCQCQGPTPNLNVDDASDAQSASNPVRQWMMRMMMMLTVSRSSLPPGDSDVKVRAGLSGSKSVRAREST
eukprot:1739838-Rhodomonas_salina.1